MLLLGPLALLRGFAPQEIPSELRKNSEGSALKYIYIYIYIYVYIYIYI